MVKAVPAAYKFHSPVWEGSFASAYPPATTMGMVILKMVDRLGVRK